MDVNRVGSNHAYYNVLGEWVQSGISGAIMMRPLLGRYVSGSGVAELQPGDAKWNIFPNPARDNIEFRFDSYEMATYRITDIQGRILKNGAIANGGSADISQLSPGMYFVTLISEGKATTTQKIIKL